MTKFYSNDVNKDTLKVQLETLKHTFLNNTIARSDCHTYLTTIYAQASTYIAGDLLRCCGTYTNLTDNDNVLCASENQDISEKHNVPN